MIDVNSYHYIMVQKVFLPKLLERTKQGKRCALMGTSSYLGLAANVALKVYAPSKAVDYYMSFNIAKELKLVGP